MFERFTEGSKAVLADARELAVELRSGHIMPGHILFGCTLAREETAGAPLRACGITAASVRSLLPVGRARSSDLPDIDALRAIGIEYVEIRSAVDKTFGEDALDSAPDRRVPTRSVGRTRFTPEAKRALELCLQLAVKELHQDRMMPGHLLLGLLRLDDDLVTDAVEQSGTTVALLSAKVLESLAAG